MGWPGAYVQRAAIVLLEKGVHFERINVDLAAKPDWFLALSPTGKVPLLKVEQAEGPTTILFESMVICEYLEETHGGTALYAVDALSRAQQRAWIEYGTETLAEVWQFLNAQDRATADTKCVAFWGRLEKLEGVLDEGPYFSGAKFSMVDAVFAPLSDISTSWTQRFFCRRSRVCRACLCGGKRWRHDQAYVLLWEMTMLSDSGSTCVIVRRSLRPDCGAASCNETCFVTSSLFISLRLTFWTSSCKLQLRL